MLKINYFYYFFVLLAFALSACNPESDLAPRGKYQNGVIILNEGNFTSGNGSLSFYDLDSAKYKANIFQAENGVGLGAYIQNAFIYDDKIYIVCNAPDKIEVVDRFSMKSVGTITFNLANPYAMTFVGNKIYVSNWGTLNPTTFEYTNPFIAVYDLNRTFLKKIARPKQPQNLWAVGNRVLVSDVSSNTITSINALTDLPDDSVVVGNQPDKLAGDINFGVWVLCRSGKLVRINPFNMEIDKTINNVKTLGFNEKMTINTGGTQLYWLASGASFPNFEVHTISISDTEAPDTPLITGQYFNGIGYGFYDELLYIGVAPNYTANGKVKRYRSGGAFQNEIDAGIAPNGFIFQ
jgi:hypothetical protein